MENFLAGNIELWKSYWLVMILGNGLLDIIIRSLIKMRVSKWIITFVSLPALGYAIFAGIGVWNSSNNYNGWYIWVILAKIVIVLMFIRLLLGFVGGVILQASVENIEQEEN